MRLAILVLHFQKYPCLTTFPLSSPDMMAVKPVAKNGLSSLECLTEDLLRLFESGAFADLVFHVDGEPPKSESHSQAQCTRTKTAAALCAFPVDETRAIETRLFAFEG